MKVKEREKEGTTRDDGDSRCDVGVVRGGGRGFSAASSTASGLGLPAVGTPTAPLGLAPRFGFDFLNNFTSLDSDIIIFNCGQYGI